MDVQARYNAVSRKTATNLKAVAQSQQIRDLSALSLPEIDATVELISRVMPAGNVPGIILNGLARLAGRKPPSNIVQRDVNLLFKGVEQALDKAVYGAFFAGPAAIIWGYQNLLKLAGKDPEESFPQGTWQFYVDYAMREDTARHANETHGFDTTLRQHRVSLSPVDRISAWVMAAITCLHQYPHLLANEWRERVSTSLLAELAGEERYTRLYGRWSSQRPWERGQDAGPDETYPAYRRRKFEAFLAEATQDMPGELRQAWTERLRQAEAVELPAYQEQMSILAYLEPGPYGETRHPINLKQAHVGLIYRGGYYLIPICTPGGDQPASVTTVRTQIASLVAYPAATRPVQLTRLARLKRTALAGLRQKMDRDLAHQLELLRRVPILLNSDQRPRFLPLAELRQAERGVGDHALTLFDTGESFVFDQSHIFFDGGWGAALAEILTDEAVAWAVYLAGQPPAQPGQARPYALNLVLSPAELARIEQAPVIAPETSAETEAVHLPAMLALRKLFKRRNDLIDLTINDLLVLYRAIHVVTYAPAPDLLAQIQQLQRLPAVRPAADAALQAIQPVGRVNPAIVIPVDASQRNPRDRLYPLTFEVPLAQLDLLNLHRQVIAALAAYQQASGDRDAAYQHFDGLQRTYLASLAGFGMILAKARQIAVAGESASVGTIKLLAHMPAPVQRLLDQIPSRFELLNDLIKGREVFSNLGMVASTSTLTRFITAKDDNDKKLLAWGVLTDAQGMMRLTLRDFRPHVGLLMSAGYRDLAVSLTQDYLTAFARGLNDYIRDLHQITLASRETRLGKPGEQG